MFIETEQTPNPATLKFLPGRAVMGSASAVDFTHEENARQASPLAGALFAIDGVAGVFFGSDFISVTKTETEEWYVMKPAVLGAIMQHFVTNQPILSDASHHHNNTQSTEPAPVFDEEDSEIVDKIQELLATRVRPAVAQDGGDIVFQGFERGIVYLTLKGACAGCPSSTATLKMGIENMLRHYIPEVLEVRQAAR